MSRKHISYNQLVNSLECGWYHKLDKIDGLVPFTGNLYSAFGRAVHETAEYIFHQDNYLRPESLTNIEGKFCQFFINEIKELKNSGYFDSQEAIELSQRLDKNMFEIIREFRTSGEWIVQFIFPEMIKEFGKFEIFSIEEELRVPIGDTEYDFLGYIDLVIRTEDGKIHIIDWKTCSWGWGAGYDKARKRNKKKSDKLTQYQLTLYKNYFMETHGLEEHIKDIETHFVLLKRTPGKEKNSEEMKNPVEFYRVTSGKKKIENALKLVNEFVYNLSNQIYVKNYKNCESFKGYSPCVFYKTQHCKREYVKKNKGFNII